MGEGDQSLLMLWQLHVVNLALDAVLQTRQSLAGQRTSLTFLSPFTN